MTGLASGPHLDYRLKKNGVFVNPVTAHRNMPPGKPIAPDLVDAYQAARARLEWQMTGFDSAAPSFIVRASR
jgi:hypothetical protein